MAAAQVPPFGLVLPSRPVEAAPTVLSPTQYLFTLSATPYFSHIVAFIIPGTTLPLDTLAGVYIQFPSSAPQFQFLGALANDKQSAIFRVGDGSPSGQSDANFVDQDEMTDVDTSPMNGGQPMDGSVTVGFSIEPTASIQNQLALLETAQENPSTALVVSSKRQSASPITTKVLAQRIIQNAFNFLASFSGTTAGAGGEEMVPLKTFRAWWEKFERRVEMDPGFLEREGNA
jgi:hypothetical protein